MTLSIVVLLAVGALLALGIVVVVLALLYPAASRRRIEALFRRPSRPPKAPGPDHYYRPYWS